MNIFPIITRELRVEARRGFNHRLRVLAGLLSMLGLIVMILESGAPPARVGIQMFGVMHVTMLAFALVMVPVIASDSLARERREGTLGLLFLTHLTAWEIVLAKAFVHAIRAAGCWLAALPVFVVPFLLGGLTWLDFVTAATLQFIAIGLGLGISMCVSAKLRAQSVALGFSIVLNLLAIWIVGLGFFAILAAILFKTRSVPSPNWISWETLVLLPSVLLSGILDGRTWSSLTSLIPGITYATWYQILVELVLAAIVIMAALLWLAARLAQAGWRDRLRSAAQEKWHQRFFGQFVWKNYFHRRAGRLLDRNPIVWLQGYSVEARLGKWGWCLFSTIVVSVTPLDLGQFTD
ncbi:MAG: ABC transporter permease subunit, partial [Opitutaceae bacterium]|nr:ABC transporter permease subunit [Verrucomicrobiales bacterium]